VKRYRHIFIANPEAGRKSCLREISEFVIRLQELGIEAYLFTPDSKNDCKAQAKKATDETSDENVRPTLIYACGGDGTLNDILNGVMMSDYHENVAITHVPKGSGNDFIKQFSRPESFAFENFIEEELVIQKIDMMKVNRDFCLNIVSFGLDARIGTGVGKFRGILSGKAAYGASVVANLLKPLSRKMTVRASGRAYIAKEMTMVCICNGGWYGGSFHPMPDADIQDGWLDVLVVKKISRAQAATFLSAYKKGQYQKFPKLIDYFRTKRLEVATAACEPINLDGELSIKKCSYVSVVPNGINFFAPKSAW